MNSKRKKTSGESGFSLIELLVSMFILVMLVGAMTVVSVSIFQSYRKSKAIKTVSENISFALNSIAKDVRMGKIESAYATGSRSDYLFITRNRDRVKVCYRVEDAYLGKQENVSGANCSSDENDYEKIVDLSGTGMSFDIATSGFYSLPTDAETIVTPGQNRGWTEINLNIENPTMETDSIRVQTIVSSRDYGWEEAP